MVGFWGEGVVEAEEGLALVSGGEITFDDCGFVFVLGFGEAAGVAVGEEGIPKFLLRFRGVGGRSFWAARFFFEACSIVEVANSLGYIKLFLIITVFWSPLYWLRFASYGKKALEHDFEAH